ncbi:MAG TPA: hypothetical protein G4O07_01325 [Dehalococcoidia bacterium]|nr:hypothetical protein [Dehalococcoidia bacterium]
MEWQIVVALIIILPVVILPAVFVRYLGVGRVTDELRKADEKISAP